MEQFNKYRSPIVLGVLIMFLMLLAFYILGAQPTNKELSLQNAEIKQLEKETDFLQTQINELKNNSASIDPEQQELLEALPKGDDSEGLIDALRSVGTLTQARLKDISFVLDEANPIQQMTGAQEMLFPTVKQIKMTAVVEGTYTSIREWMNELQLLPRIVNVDMFNFQRSYEELMEGSSEDIMTANVSFTAYYEAVTQAQTSTP